MSLVASLKTLEELDHLQGLADLVEVRLDYLDDLTNLKKPSLPTIFTFRKKEQGGRRDISEKERFKLIEEALKFGPEYCDIEADTDPAFIAHLAKYVKLIGSYHNFEETPRNLNSVLKQMKNPHFSIYKLALKANSTLDMLRLMAFKKQSAVPMIAISMGEYGKPSRVLGPIVGNAFNYSGVEEDLELHRYSLKTLHEVFRYRHLNPQTKIYALLGDPVEQSIGHLYHNGRFAHDAVYIKMRLKPEELGEFFKLAYELPFAGFSVTMPLKEAIVPYLDQADFPAINTISIRNGKTYGTNTDGRGALNAIEKHCKVKGKKLAILGAGGTALAIAHEAKKRGAIVSIFNRTIERAKKVALEIGCNGFGLDELKDYDILINTIPVDCLVPLQPKTYVMDVVYSPRETPLLKRAQQLGCTCIYGEEMFTQQADLQQMEWHA